MNHFMVDPDDIPILIDALEGIEDRSLDLNRILLGAQIAHRNNTRPYEEALVKEWADELEALPTFVRPSIPPPQAFPSGD